MKLLVINPNTTQAMTESIDAMARRNAQSGTSIVTISPDYGPRSIEGHFEETIAALATVETVARHRDDFDAFVIACFGDPGVGACREITDKPVIGIAAAAMHFACFLGHKFSIVTVMRRAQPFMEDLVRQNGLEAKCASVRFTDLTVLEIEANPKRAVTELTEAAKRAVAEDGAEVICLGCAGMGLLDEEIRAHVDVPIVDGVMAGVKLAEAIHQSRLKTSKVAAYAWPEHKEPVKCSPELVRIASR